MSWYGWNWYLRYRCLLVHWTGEGISMGWQADSRIHWMTSRSMNPISSKRVWHRSSGGFRDSGAWDQNQLRGLCLKICCYVCFIFFLFLSKSSNDKYLLHSLLISFHVFKWQIFASLSSYSCLLLQMTNICNFSLRCRTPSIFCLVSLSIWLQIANTVNFDTDDYDPITMIDYVLFFRSNSNQLRMKMLLAKALSEKE